MLKKLAEASGTEMANSKKEIMVQIYFLRKVFIGRELGINAYGTSKFTHEQYLYEKIHIM